MNYSGANLASKWLAVSSAAPAWAALGGAFTLRCAAARAKLATAENNRTTLRGAEIRTAAVIAVPDSCYSHAIYARPRKRGIRLSGLLQRRGQERQNYVIL